MGCPGLGKSLFPIDFSEGKIAFRVLVSMNRRVFAFKNGQIPHQKFEEVVCVVPHGGREPPQGGGGGEEVGSKRKLVTSEELYAKFDKKSEVGVPSTQLKRCKADKMAA